VSGDGLQGVIKLSIGVLCAAALVLILIILSGSELDDTSVQAIGTAAAMAFLSLTAVAGSHLRLRRPRLALLAGATVGVSVLAFLLTTAAIWSEDNWKAAGICLVLAFACGHSSVLLAAADEQDDDGVRFVRGATIVALWLLALLLIDELAKSGNDTDPQGVGVIAVLYVLGNIVLPLLRRAAPQRHGAGEIQLDHLELSGTDTARTAHFYAEGLGIGASVTAGAENKVCLAWPGTAESAVAHLANRGIEVVGEPAVRSGAHGVGVSVCCRDPDGRLVELISYR
jgi:type IV secretory pathway TrbD component